ncbi:hypothetical protein HispidOSU_004604, partial [Sigmodon hispidus]
VLPSLGLQFHQGPGLHVVQSFITDADHSGAQPLLAQPHQAPGPRPEGNAIAMETAPAPSVAPFSSPAPPALPGCALACSSFASPGEPRARAWERESGYACALGTSPSGDPGCCRLLGQDAGRAGGGGSGFAGSRDRFCHSTPAAADRGRRGGGEKLPPTNR